MKHPLPSAVITAILWTLVASIWSTAGPTGAQSPTPTAPRAPAPDVIENVAISEGGLEVFPHPDRRSGRFFAAVTGSFAPFVAGRTEDSRWILILYFDDFFPAGRLVSSWSPRRSLELAEEDIATLPVIDPAAPPDLPNLVFNPYAVRPRGMRRAVPTLSRPRGGAGAGGCWLSG